MQASARSFFQPLQPVVGFSMQMHHRSNKDKVALNAVNDAVRKPVYDTTTKPSPNFSIMQRVFGEFLNIPFDRLQKRLSETFAAILVIGRRFLDFNLRERIVNQLCHPNSRRTCSNSWSPAIPWVLPAWKLSRRFSASATHVSSIAVSGALSRLRIKLSASCSRSPGGNSNARRSISFVCGDIASKLAAET